MKLNPYEWSRIARANKLRPTTPQVRYGHASAAFSSGVVVHGGYNNEEAPTWLDDVWALKYDASRAWSWSKIQIRANKNAQSPLTLFVPLARYSHTLVKMQWHPTQETFYLFGGDDGGQSSRSSKNSRSSRSSSNGGTSGYHWGHYFNDVWKLHLNAKSLVGTWRKLEHMKENSGPSPRTCHTSVVLKHNALDCMLVFGGLTTTTVHTKVQLLTSNELWMMSPDGTGMVHWTLLQPQTPVQAPTVGIQRRPPARYGHTAAVTSGDTARMYVYGGKSRESKVLYSDLWSYNKHTNKWATVVSHGVGGHGVPVGLLYGTMTSMVVESSRQQLLLYGGASGCARRCTTESNTWVFDLKTAEWTLLLLGTTNKKNQPMHRYRHSMTKVTTASSSAVTNQKKTGEQGHVVVQHVMFGGESYGEVQKYHSDAWTMASSSVSSVSSVKGIEQAAVEGDSVALAAAPLHVLNVLLLSSVVFLVCVVVRWQKKKKHK